MKKQDTYKHLWWPLQVPDWSWDLGEADRIMEGADVHEEYCAIFTLK